MGHPGRVLRGSGTRGPSCSTAQGGAGWRLGPAAPLCGSHLLWSRAVSGMETTRPTWMCLALAWCPSRTNGPHPLKPTSLTGSCHLPRHPRCNGMTQSTACTLQSGSAGLRAPGLQRRRHRDLKRICACFLAYKWGSQCLLLHAAQTVPLTLVYTHFQQLGEWGDCRV